MCHTNALVATADKGERFHARIRVPVSGHIRLAAACGMLQCLLETTLCQVKVHAEGCGPHPGMKATAEAGGRDDTLVVEVADVVVQVAGGAVVQEADYRGDEGAAATGLQNELRRVRVVLDVGLQAAP